jgi:hypothetical protein
MFKSFNIWFGLKPKHKDTDNPDDAKVRIAACIP